jgi:TPR repeat protein
LCFVLLPAHFFVFAVTGGQVFRWAEKAVAQGERDGFFMMGYCFERGEGIPVDLTRAKQNYFEAAKLGHVAAMTGER